MSAKQWTRPEPGAGGTATTVDPIPEQVVAGWSKPQEDNTGFVQLLDAHGQRRAEPRFEPYVDDVDGAALRDLYRDLVLVRRADRECNAMQRQGQLGLWVPLLGQEAAQIGSARATEQRDMVFPSYREHGVAYARGIDFRDLLGIFRCSDHSGWDFHRHRFHPYTIVIGDQVLNATGYAMGQKIEGKVGGDDSEATIVYFGDGATSQGDVHEGFVWSSVYNAPVVFFCQNNQWAISESTAHQSRVPLHRRADGYGFPGIQVDGNDVLACLAVTRWALERCRQGDGPVLIEAFTYRMDAHTTTDDPNRYRLPGELEEWQNRDPIERVRVHLEETGNADQEFFDTVQAEADRFAEQLRDYCFNMPDPPPERVFSAVYAEPSPQLEAQREEYLTYLGGFVDGGENG